MQRWATDAANACMCLAVKGLEDSQSIAGGGAEWKLNGGTAARRLRNVMGSLGAAWAATGDCSLWGLLLQMASLQAQAQVQVRVLGYFVSVQDGCRCRVWVGVRCRLQMPALPYEVLERRRCK